MHRKKTPTMSLHSRLDSLGDDVLIQCASFLSTRDLAQCTQVNRYFADIMTHDILWKARTNEDLGITSLGTTPPAFDHPGGVENFKQLYTSWRISFEGYPLEFVRRVHLFWQRFEAWTDRYAPDIRRTLLGPASEEDLRAAEEELAAAGSPLRLPVSLRLLYRFHNGQSIPFSERPSRESLHSIGWGMFGGTAFYDKLTCLRLLELSELAEATSSLDIDPSSGRPIPARENFYQHHTGHENIVSPLPTITFAINVNSQSISKAYYVAADLSPGEEPLRTGGEVYTNTEHFENFCPCHPLPLRGASRNSCLVAWLEEYMYRLDAGIYEYQPLDLTEPESLGSNRALDIKMISLFPVKPMFNSEHASNASNAARNCGATTAVTRGVEITACPAFIPEASNPWRNEFMWSYSIRMRLLKDSPERPAGLQSCQLTHRHWRISEYESIKKLEEGEASVSEVHGEAVIGLYPTLSITYSQPRTNGHTSDISWPFAYQSCSTARSYPGSFGGRVDFVPGSKDAPTGPSFEASIDPFTLTVPDFIY